MVRFFADPGRKFKTFVQEAERTIEAKEQEIATIRGIADAHKKKTEGLESDLAAERLRIDAYKRLALMFVFWLTSEIGVSELLWYFGEGDSILNKLYHGWEFLVAAWLIMLVFSWFYLGQKRLQALGWPMSKLLRAKETLSDD
jgi:hypothetical protein